jgi:hypothetical protein
VLSYRYDNTLIIILSHASDINPFRYCISITYLQINLPTYTYQPTMKATMRCLISSTALAVFLLSVCPKQTGAFSVVPTQAKVKHLSSFNKIKLDGQCPRLSQPRKNASHHSSSSALSMMSPADFDLTYLSSTSMHIANAAASMVPEPHTPTIFSRLALFAHFISDCTLGTATIGILNHIFLKEHWAQIEASEEYKQLRSAQPGLLNGKEPSTESVTIAGVIFLLPPAAATAPTAVIEPIKQAFEYKEIELVDYVQPLQKSVPVLDNDKSNIYLGHEKNCTDPEDTNMRMLGGRFLLPPLLKSATFSNPAFQYRAPKLDYVQSLDKNPHFLRDETSHDCLEHGRNKAVSEKNMIVDHDETDGLLNASPIALEDPAPYPAEDNTIDRPDKATTFLPSIAPAHLAHLDDKDQVGTTVGEVLENNLLEQELKEIKSIMNLDRGSISETIGHIVNDIKSIMNLDGGSISETIGHIVHEHRDTERPKQEQDAAHAVEENIVGHGFWHKKDVLHNIDMAQYAVMGPANATTATMDTIERAGVATADSKREESKNRDERDSFNTKTSISNTEDTGLIELSSLESDIGENPEPKMTTGDSAAETPTNFESEITRFIEDSAPELLAAIESDTTQIVATEELLPLDSNIDLHHENEEGAESSGSMLLRIRDIESVHVDDPETEGESIDIVEEEEAMLVLDEHDDATNQVDENSEDDARNNIAMAEYKGPELGNKNANKTDGTDITERAEIDIARDETETKNETECFDLKTLTSNNEVEETTEMGTSESSVGDQPESNLTIADIAPEASVEIESEFVHLDGIDELPPLQSNSIEEGANSIGSVLLVQDKEIPSGDDEQDSEAIESIEPSMPSGNGKHFTEDVINIANETLTTSVESVIPQPSEDEALNLLKDRQGDASDEEFKMAQGLAMAAFKEEINRNTAKEKEEKSKKYKKQIKNDMAMVREYAKQKQMMRGTGTVPSSLDTTPASELLRKLAEKERKRKFDSIGLLDPRVVEPSKARRVPAQEFLFENETEEEDLDEEDSDDKEEGIELKDASEHEETNEKKIASVAKLREHKFSTLSLAKRKSVVITAAAIVVGRRLILAYLGRGLL